MEEVAAVRRSALDAVGDVEPGRLRERIRGRLVDGSMAPGVLTLLSARAVRDCRDIEREDPAGGDAAADPTGAVSDRGAGVQLIYEGLRLTRTLAADPPWERESGAGLPDGGRAPADAPTDATADAPTDATADAPADGDVGVDAPEADRSEADMAILVADVMVARGFYLLARTEAAERAVRVVQAFGRDQTNRRTTGDATLEGNLEVDVFELAVVAGTTAVDATPPASLREFATDLAREDGPAEGFSVADGLFSEATVDRLAGHLDGDGVAPSADR